MAIIDKSQRQMFDLFDSLRGSVGYYNLFSNAIHLIFLKYLMSFSDRFENLGIESYKAISAFKRKYDIARNGGESLEPWDVDELIRTLDSEYVFKDIRLSDSLRVYDTLFGDRTNQRIIFRILDEIDVEFSEEFLINFFEVLIQRCSRDVRATGESTTSKYLREIAVKILDIQPVDTVLNCFAGFSTFALNMPKDIRYIGYELNTDAYVISKMLLTMLGIRGAELFNQDFLLSDTRECANKVFSDGPINMRYDNPTVEWTPWAKGLKTKDGNLLILYKVLDSIRFNGTAVIAVPGKVLFSNHPSYIELRRRYLAEGLKAIVSLPPLWSGTVINTNLLVVEKGYNGPVEFIDAQNIGVKDRARNVVLSKDDIDKIYDAYKNQVEIPGFSRLVKHMEINEKDSWQPTLFVEPIIEKTTKNVEDIDAELNSLYEELKNNLK